MASEAVSIILKVWNASRHVKLCLEALLLKTGYPFELIIIDNGSRPRLKDYLHKISQKDQRVHVIDNPTNMGPGYANHQGVSRAVNRLVCLIDSDVLVPQGWLERLVETFHHNPNLRMLSPLQPEERLIYPFEQLGTESRQIWYEIKQQYSQLSPLEQFQKFSMGMSIEDFDIAVRKVNPARIQFIEAPPDFLSSCCVLVDGSFAAEVGGIADLNFRGYGSEDVDLCWRIAEAGGLIAKTNGVYVHHFLGASLSDNNVNRATALRLANQILYAKWKGQLLSRVIHKIQVEGKEPVEYLESHFIYPALARHTTFIDDLRDVLNRTDIPEDLVWRSG